MRPGSTGSTSGSCDPLAQRAVRRTSVAQNPDRKSTRLNSSHLVISYAVFCLKKKNDCDSELWQIGHSRLTSTIKGFRPGELCLLIRHSLNRTHYFDLNSHDLCSGTFLRRLDH